MAWIECENGRYVNSNKACVFDTNDSSKVSVSFDNGYFCTVSEHKTPEEAKIALDKLIEHIAEMEVKK